MISCRDISSAGFLRLPQVLKLIPISKSSWYAGIKAGRFPASVKLGPKTAVWRKEDILGLVARVGAEGGMALG
ncbi:helix-turn-helix transcriptional regulator [Solidesulfovibrio sp.]